MSKDCVPAVHQQVVIHLVKQPGNETPHSWNQRDPETQHTEYGVYTEDGLYIPVNYLKYREGSNMHCRWNTAHPLRHLSHRCVDEVEEVAVAIMAVDHGGSLGLDSDTSLPLHREVVQYLSRHTTSLYHSCTVGQNERRWFLAAVYTQVDCP